MGFKTRPEGGFTILSAEEAKAQFDLDQYEGFMGESEVHVYAGSTKLEELDLDANRDVVIDGDLTVKKDVTNLDGDSGDFLLVRGNLAARNLIGGGSMIVVTGNAKLRNTLYGHYNHGSIDIGGNVKAKAVVCSDHAMGIAGEIDAITVSWRGIKADFEDDDITRIMSPKVLDDDFIDDRKMFTHLAANKSPVRSGIVPSRVLVQRELAGLDRNEVTTLDLESKGLRNFPREVLDLDNLEELVLESNEIEDNLPDDLPRLAKLRILNLRSFASYDNSPTLPESFGEMKALTHLNLHYNHVTLPRSIAKLDSLESLRMPIFEGMTVPETFGDIPNLQSLQVWAYDGYPAASEFPLFPLSLKSLRHLEVSSISAPSIPEAITTLTELESLEFGGVRNLTSFPDLSSLSTLRKLRFDGYGSSNFALLDSIMHLVWLEDLDLGRWHMPTLPEGLAQFKNLKRLDLSFNELKAVPQWLLDLDLEFLDISSNELDASASKALQEAHPNADLRL